MSRTAGRRSPARPRPTEETVLGAAVLLLCGLGIAMVFSASSVYSQREYGVTWAVVGRHVLYVAIGVAGMVLAARIPLRVWRDRLSVLLLAVAVAALVVVAIPGMPLADEVNGATRWIRLGPLGFQPSELAKLALVLWLARTLSLGAGRVGDRDMLLRVLLVFGTVAALVMVGDDFGTTVLIGVIFLTMWFLGGAPVGQVGLVGGAMVGAGALGLLYLEGFRTTRVLAFLSPEEHADGAGYQTLQSQIGFATGGLWGRGPGASKAKWGFLPEAHTDFILAVIGEELGLLGSISIIAALVAVVASGMVIGVRCRDPFGRLVALGISVWFAVQAVVNVGVSVGALPTKGIPLPFVSYGGSSMVISLVAVGILFAVSRSGARRATAPRPSARRARSPQGARR